MSSDDQTDAVCKQYTDALEAVHDHILTLSRSVTADNAEDIIAQIMKCTSSFKSLSQGTKTVEYAHVTRIGDATDFNEIVTNFHKAGWSVTETNLVVSFTKRVVVDQ